MSYAVAKTSRYLAIINLFINSFFIFQINKCPGGEDPSGPISISEASRYALSLRQIMLLRINLESADNLARAHRVIENVCGLNFNTMRFYAAVKSGLSAKEVGEAIASSSKDDAGAVDIDHMGLDGKTALHWAVENNDHNNTRQLLSISVDKEKLNLDGKTAKDIALEKEAAGTLSVEMKILLDSNVLDSVSEVVSNISSPSGYSDLGELEDHTEMGLGNI